MREPDLDERILGPASTRGCKPDRVRFRFSETSLTGALVKVAFLVIGKSCWWEGSWWTAVRVDAHPGDKGQPWVATLTLSEEGPQPETFELPSLIEYLKAVEVPAT
jgi:hypothetical protein